MLDDNEFVEISSKHSRKWRSNIKQLFSSFPFYLFILQSSSINCDTCSKIPLISSFSSAPYSLTSIADNNSHESTHSKRSRGKVLKNRLFNFPLRKVQIAIRNSRLRLKVPSYAASLTSWTKPSLSFLVHCPSHYCYNSHTL